MHAEPFKIASLLKEINLSAMLCRTWTKLEQNCVTAHILPFLLGQFPSLFTKAKV